MTLLSVFATVCVLLGFASAAFAAGAPSRFSAPGWYPMFEAGDGVHFQWPVGGDIGPFADATACFAAAKPLEAADKAAKPPGRLIECIWLKK
jgi:hypothetical protein